MPSNAASASAPSPESFVRRRSARGGEALHFVRRVRLEVSAEEARWLDGQSKICNHAYNTLLEEANRLRGEFAEAKQAGDEERAKEIARTLYHRHGLRDRLVSLKEQKPFLARVHSSPLKNAALRLEAAIRAHQDSRGGRRAGPEMKWPGYRSWKKSWFSLEYEERKGWKVREGCLHLTLGTNAEGKRLRVKLPLVDAPAGLAEAKGVRITRKAGLFYACFTMEQEARQPRRKRSPLRVSEEVQARNVERALEGLRAIYLDPNLKNFAYGVSTEGEAFEFPNLSPLLRPLERQADRVKRKRDRCKRKQKEVTFEREDGSVHRHWEPSRRWKRLDGAVKRLEERMRDLKKHHSFALAHWLCRHYDVIGIGDFSPENADSGLGRKGNRAVRNRANLSQFREVLLWVAGKSGRTALVLDESGTTRTCYFCLQVVEGGIPLTLREWVCPECKKQNHRDENSSQNGLERMLAALEQLSSGISRCPARATVRETQAVERRCTLAFRPGGRWEMVPWQQGPDAATNQIGRPEATGRTRRKRTRVLFAAGGRGSHRSRPSKSPTTI